MREGASIPRRARLARHTEPSPVCDVDFDLIPFLESERLDHDGGKANRKAIAHFATCMLALRSLDIHFM